MSRVADIGVSLSGFLLTCVIFACLSTTSHAVPCPDYLRSTEQFQAELTRNPAYGRSDSPTLREATNISRELGENSDALSRSYRRSEELSSPYRQQMRGWNAPVTLSAMSDSTYAAEMLRFMATRRAQITERFRGVLLELLRIARQREALYERHTRLQGQLDRLRIRLRTAMDCDDDDAPPPGASPVPAQSCASPQATPTPTSPSMAQTLALFRLWAETYSYGARSTMRRVERVLSAPPAPTPGHPVPRIQGLPAAPAIFAPLFMMLYLIVAENDSCQPCRDAAVATARTGRVRPQIANRCELARAPACPPNALTVPPEQWKTLGEEASIRNYFGDGTHYLRYCVTPLVGASEGCLYFDPITRVWTGSRCSA